MVKKVLYWIVALATPLALTFLGLRLLLTPAFLQVEYRLPGFPEDPYGFSRQERLHWSRLALDYLLNDAGIDFLADLRFPDGSPLYNQRELVHMLDVKEVVRVVLPIGYGTWLALLGLGLWARRAGWWHLYLGGLQRGGWLTVVLVTGLAVVGLVSFWNFFTLFHQLFFEGDSWLFAYSDTLIRLFPLRFWQDAFLITGGLALVSGLALGLGLKPRPAAGV
jgi:integral membrane protein (TIGR01906 family)